MRKNREPGWSWFENLTESDQPYSNEIDVPGVFASCFKGANGEAALAHLAELTMARPMGPQCDNDVLRHLEGQRYLVSYIIGLVRQGRVSSNRTNGE